MDKLRVTYVHKVSNPRDQNNNIPHAVMLLDLRAITDAVRSQDAKALAKYLRKVNVLSGGDRIREHRYDREKHAVHVFPAGRGWHCVSIELRPTSEPLTLDKHHALMCKA
jgi:hypothetical protein